MGPPVNVVPQEDVVEVIDVLFLVILGVVRATVEVEEPHQVLKLTVDIPKNFCWGIDLQCHGLALEYLDDLLA